MKLGFAKKESVGKKGLLVCPECNAVYYHKSWHHNLQKYAALKNKEKVGFETCPADSMQKDGRFVGLVVIENYPAGVHDSIVNLVEHVAEVANEKHVLDRILELHESSQRIEVKTSDGVLARSIGKRIHSAYKGSEIEINQSEEESITRIKVYWT